jgi:hypothetical protein
VKRRVAELVHISASREHQRTGREFPPGRFNK